MWVWLCVFYVYLCVFFTNRDLNLFHPQWRLVFIFHFGVFSSHRTNLCYSCFDEGSLSPFLFSSYLLTWEIARDFCALSNKKIPFPFHSLGNFFSLLHSQLLSFGIIFILWTRLNVYFPSIVFKYSAVFCNLSSFFSVRQRKSPFSCTETNLHR